METHSLTRCSSASWGMTPSAKFHLHKSAKYASFDIPSDSCVSLQPNLHKSNIRHHHRTLPQRYVLSSIQLKCSQIKHQHFVAALNSNPRLCIINWLHRQSKNSGGGRSQAYQCGAATGLSVHVLVAQVEHQRGSAVEEGQHSNGDEELC